MSKDFIDLLFDDALSARGRIIVSAIVLAVLAALGTVMWLPWGLGVHIAATGLGFGLGWLLAAKRVDVHEASLRSHWNEWMRLAPACDTVADVGRKVAGQRIANRAYAIAAILTLLWVAELIALALYFTDTASAVLSAIVIGANGLMAGALLGHQIRLMTWTRTFARSLAEMMQDGELAVWGSR